MSYKTSLVPGLSLCVITAKIPDLKRTHEDIAHAAIEGGATIIQFRDKVICDDEFKETAVQIGVLAKEAGVLFIVNDRVDIATRIGADGTHVGQKDAKALNARRVLGNKAILGVSVATMEEATAAETDGADYLGAGPVFATGSKNDAGQPIGLKALAGICRAVRIPVIGIGGIDRYNADSVLKSGAAGIAVIAAVANATDMVTAVKELKGCVDNAASG